MRFVCSVVGIAAFLLIVIGGPIHELMHSHWPAKGLAKPTFKELRSGTYAKAVESQLEQGSSLNGLARPKYNELRYLLLGETNQGVFVGPGDWLFLSHRMKQPNEHQMRLLGLSVDKLAEVEAFLKTKGVTTIFALLPRKQSVFPDQVPSSDKLAYFPTFDLQRDMMLAKGLDVPDLRPAMRASEIRPYLKNDEHWRPAGAFVAAKVLSDHLRGLLGDEPVPGRPLDAEPYRFPAREFIGQEQKRLGFAKGGWLDRRFTDEIVEIRSILRGQPERWCLGSLDPEPILVIGTSMSAGPYWLTSHLMGNLGVHIENYARDGFAAGYRGLDRFALWLTEQRPYPKYLIWEIPEDFLPREADYIHSPLQMATNLFAHHPYAIEPFDLAGVALDQVVEVGPVEAVPGGILPGDEEQMLSGRMTSKDATLTIELPESFRSASNPAVKFHITVPPGQPRPAGIVHVSWYGESGDEPLGAKRIPIRITRWLHPVIVPLTSSDGTVPRKVVIKPYDYPTRFQFGRVELWSSKNK